MVKKNSTDITKETLISINNWCVSVVFFSSRKQFFGHIFIANFSIKNSQMKYVSVPFWGKMPLHTIARVVHISLQYDNGFIMICHEQRSIYWIECG